MINFIKKIFGKEKKCEPTRTEEERQQIIKEMLSAPVSVKVRGFEEVSEKFKNVNVETTLPTRGSKESAGYDFYSKEEIVIKPGKQYVFWTDVKAYMMPGEVLEMYVRSSIGIKKGLVLSNSVGIIDQDYYENLKTDGNIGVCLRNESDQPQTIEVGERIAQGIFKQFLVADNISSTNERTGGIGSTNEIK